MSDIGDDELILFHYRDGLPAQRLANIQRELTQSASLKHRYEQLLATLAAVDRELEPEPAPGFEERLWNGLRSRINETAPGSAQSVGPNVSTWRAGCQANKAPRKSSSRWALGFASAAAVALAIGMILLQQEPREPVQARHAPNVVITGDTVAERVLATKVAEHLRSTELILLTVLNENMETEDPARGELLTTLVEDNRLYSAAAARRGNKALAGFLSSMQATLIEVANHSNAGGIQSSHELREFISNTDLLFQVRAVRARLHSGSQNA